MSDNNIKPQSRSELFLAKAAGQDVTPPKPQSRIEKTFAVMSGMTGIELEPPQSRLEYFAGKAAENAGGGGIEPTGTKSITANGTYDVAEYAEAEVNVPQPSGTKTITSNGTGIDVSAYATADVAVPTEMDYTNEDGLVNGRLGLDGSDTYENTRVTLVAQYALYGQNHVTTLKLPNVTSAERYAFYSMSWLQSADFSSLETIGAYAFSNAFYYIGGKGTFSFPKLVTVGDSAFRQCGGANFSFDVLETIPSNMFYQSSCVETVELKSAKQINTYAFNSCRKLTWISFDNITAIPTLSSTNAFAVNTALTALYFPDDLVEEAKQASNWATYASKIKPLSEKPTV